MLFLTMISYMNSSFLYRFLCIDLKNAVNKQMLTNANTQCRFSIEKHLYTLAITIVCIIDERLAVMYVLNVNIT